MAKKKQLSSFSDSDPVSVFTAIGADIDKAITKANALQNKCPFNEMGQVLNRLQSAKTIIERTLSTPDPVAEPMEDV